MTPRVDLAREQEELEEALKQARILVKYSDEHDFIPIEVSSSRELLLAKVLLREAALARQQEATRSAEAEIARLAALNLDIGKERLMRESAESRLSSALAELKELKAKVSK